MSLEYWDKREIIEASEKAGNATVAAVKKDNAETRKQVADGFNRVAEALTALTAEIKGLRADLNPSLDKPKKLPAPPQGG